MPLFNTFTGASARGEGMRGISIPPPLYTFDIGTTFPLSTGGIGGTNGGASNLGVRTGPTLAQVLATYSSVTWPWITNTTYFNMSSYQGYQQWTIPATGTYKIVCSGAGAGYNSGSGGQAIPAVASGTFALTQGQVLIFVIGQVGGYSPYSNQAPCGGGGTFAFLNATQSTSSYTTSTCLIAAGGAGGNATGNGGGASGNGTTNTQGGYSGDSYYMGGTNGGAFAGNTSGADGMGGAGITSGPVSAIGGTVATSISTGGLGGFLQYSSYGGFGGGGGFYGGGGGGGGYSGGAPGHWSAGASAGGGGSYVSSSGTSTGISTTGTPLYNGGASITRIS